MTPAPTAQPEAVVPEVPSQGRRVFLVDAATRAAQLRAEFVALGLPCTFEDWLCVKIAKLEADELRYDKLAASAFGRIEDQSYCEGYRHGAMSERGARP
jgi:hypothetical protein